MTIDPHKMGQAAVPAGGLLARGPELLGELAIATRNLESTSQVTLAGTRSGAGVASAAAAMDELWPDGYRERYHGSQANADRLAAELEDRGVAVVPPTLPIVAADLGAATIGALRDERWRLSKTDAGGGRVVCMPHVRRPMLREFLSDLGEIR